VGGRDKPPKTNLNLLIFLKKVSPFKKNPPPRGPQKQKKKKKKTLNFDLKPNSLFKSRGIKNFYHFLFPWGFLVYNFFLKGGAIV